MLSVGECEKILNKKSKKYSREEIKEIRDYLYGYAEIINIIRTKNES